MNVDPATFLRKVRRHRVGLGARIPLDRIYLIEELVERGVYRSKSDFLMAAIVSLLREHFPEYFDPVLTEEGIE